MVKTTFDYEGAKNAGYSDDEIQSFLNEIGLDSSPEYKNTKTNSVWQNIKNNASNFFGNFDNPTGERQIEEPKIDINKAANLNFDYEGALQSGYTPEEINQFLEENQPERSLLQKGGRIAGQLGLGIAENYLLPYDISVSPLASREAMNVLYREELGSELEDLLVRKSSGRWTDEDETHLQNIQDQLQDPLKSMENVQTARLGVRDLAEQITGVDLHPEGILEKSANWVGFIKNPRNISNLFKSGVRLKDVVKAISPTGKETLQGLGAGIALQEAEDGDFGPIGTMAAAVVGDLAGHGLGHGVEAIKNLLTKPKQTLAKAASKFTPKEKLKLQKEIIKDFRESGLQADLGTLTDSNIIKWTQARVAQSGLTGKDAEKFMHELTETVKNEYSQLAHELGEAKFANEFEAGERVKNTVNAIRESDLAAARNLYKGATKALKEGAFVDSIKLANSIEKIESQLRPGSIKSSEQQAVLNAIEKLKRDIYDSSGSLMHADVKDLINNKIALNDIINYEVQGGTKQLLKGIVADLDRAIISHGKENPTFAKNYVMANKKFSEHAKTFRNRDISNLLKTEDPAKIMGRMNSISEIRGIEKILSKTPEGRQLFDNLKRQKLDQVIGNNLVDSTTQQLKTGTFSKLLEKGKNRDIIKEILSPEAFKRLEKLQKNAGRLADALNKFHNASKSAVVAADAAIIYSVGKDLVNVLSGNPWPLIKTASGIVGARKIGQLIFDPEFLKLTEEAILASEKGTNKELIQSFEKLKPYFLQYMHGQSSEGL